jgi:autotransporter-associated beta strand protein
MIYQVVFLRTVVLLCLAMAPTLAFAQLTLMNDMVLDANALLMPSNSTYGRSINGVSFQSESLLSYGGYQYATWYHNGSNENVYIARRALTGTTWEVFDTGSTLENGDAPSWNAHNVISLGISGDGRMHFSWDLHGHTLRFRDSAPGAATGVTWDANLFNPERNSLNPGGSAISTVTYPQFTTDPNTGNMVINYRTGGSGAGNLFISTYDSTTGVWNAPHQFINGTNSIFYNDPFGSSSTNRNAYLNGLDIDSTGRLHTTWTWRETATGSSNHDIMYAYSDDGGDSWRNNAGAVVGTIGNPIDMNSPGITIVPMDRGNTLMNQQTQAVDLDNRVHMVMWHKRDDAAPVTGFTTTPAAYYHYFRNPSSGSWHRTELPTSRAVGSRPDMAYDEHGNLYVTYLSPGPGDAGGYYTNGDLIIASASKSTGYEDWEIVYTDTRDLAGEPFVDLKRLLNDGVVSVIIQENSPNTGRTGTPLRVLEFEKLANKIVWAGDDTGNWSIGTGTDWDNDNNDIGEESFENGFRVTFDDGAASFAVNIIAPVAPSSTSFANSSSNAYMLTGAGIGGSGPLNISGSGSVTLANNTNTYHGDTNIEQGKLILSGSAQLANSPHIRVYTGATLDVTNLAGGLTLNGQTITMDGNVDGAVVATNNSTVQVNSFDSLNGDLAIQSGSLVTGIGKINGNMLVDDGMVRIGANGLSSTIQPVTILIDDFNDASLSEYTRTVVNDNNGIANVTFTGSGGTLAATYSGSSAFEQVVLLRDDVSLNVGETLMVDVTMDTTTQEMDLGLAISATSTPTQSSGGGNDTRDTFDWTSVSIRPNQNSIRVNQSVNGLVNTTSGTIGSVSETSVTGFYITRNSETQFTLGYTNASNSIDATVVNYTANNVGTALGFYADLRSSGSLGSFDNLRILSSSIIAEGEVLFVEGDVTLSPHATLSFDVFSAEIGDILEIAGHFHAAGTLEVSLDQAAPSPTVGDQFNLVNFGSASGGFDAFNLPMLADGMAWNVTDILTTGQLQVVTDVDLDNDGDVDGRDFLIIQRTNPSLIPEWQAQYGNQIAVSHESMVVSVPEPNPVSLTTIALWMIMIGRRSLIGG